jgi:two-component system, NarL family, invasion response regulator UvrY
LARIVIKVFVVDDHELVRQGLRQLISEEPDMEVCGEAEDGAGLLEILDEGDCNVIVLDINLPDRSGLDILREIKDVRPELPVLILSIYPREQYAARALSEGAAGYVQKESAAEVVVSAIREAACGGSEVA